MPSRADASACRSSTTRWSRPALRRAPRDRSPLARRRPPARTRSNTTRIIDAATAAIPDVLAKAIAKRGRDLTVRFGDLVDARVQATAAGDEIWVAMATQAADGRFVDERLRDVLFRLFFDAAAAELWEPRADWPLGELAWFEDTRLGLRGLA